MTDRSTRAAADRDAITVEGGIDFRLIELLFFAYRDFISDPDAILAAVPVSAARIIGCCTSSTAIPGLTVADLLDILKITKQSLARVLKELSIPASSSSARAEDRRQRLLYPTAKGRTLAPACRGHSHAASTRHSRRSAPRPAARSSASS